MSAPKTKRRELVDLFEAKLAEINDELNARTGTTASGEPEWLVYEIKQLLAAVNAEREKLNFLPVESATVAAVEKRTGDVQYTRNLAIGLMELVLAR